MQDTWQSEDANDSAATIKAIITVRAGEKMDIEAIQKVLDPKTDAGNDLLASSPWQNGLSAEQAFQVKQAQVILGAQVHRS